MLNGAASYRLALAYRDLAEMWAKLSLEAGGQPTTAEKLLIEGIITKFSVIRALSRRVVALEGKMDLGLDNRYLRWWKELRADLRQLRGNNGLPPELREFEFRKHMAEKYGSPSDGNGDDD